MNEWETRVDRVIELLEDISETQIEMKSRQKKQFRMYAWSAGLVWLVYGTIFLFIAVTIVGAIMKSL